MLLNASGDAPRQQGSKDHFTFKPDEAYVWQATHQKWKIFDDVRTEGLFFDVVLKSVDGNAFPAHRIILCACSPYFKSLFSGRWESGNRREIAIPGVTTRVMNHILHFAYMREVKLSSLKETKELLIVANHLGVEEIVHRCFLFLLDELNSWNSVDIWDFSRTYYCQDLESASKSYILKNIVEIVCLPPKDDFQSIWNLPASDLQLFLEDCELNVAEETLTFWIIIRWVGKDPLRRHKFLYQLLLHVRWANVPKEFVEDIVAKHNFVLFCKDARSFVFYIKAQLASGKFFHNIFPPQSLKQDLNGNYLISPLNNPTDLISKWSTPRLPRNLILVVGGWCGDSPTNSAEIYEPRRKLWKRTVKSFPSILKRPRAYHSVLYHEGYMYIIGGYDGNTTYNSCDRYDVTARQWQQMCGMHSRRCYVGVTFMAGCIYAFGGSDGSDNPRRLKSAEKFYPSRNVWKRLPDMQERRSDAGACSLGRRVYVAGGFTGQECVFTVEFFDCHSNQWSNVPRMTVPRSGVSVVAYRGRVVVLGGYDGHNRLNSVEVFDPEGNEWSMMDSMRTMRSNFTACVIEGKLIVMGGFNGISTCSDVEFYDDVCETCNSATCSGIHLNLLSCKREIDRKQDVPSSSSHVQNFINDDAQTPSLESSIDDSFSAQNCLHDIISSERTDENDTEHTKWKPLPNMMISRSALSCCVLTGLSPKYLKTLLQDDS